MKISWRTSGASIILGVVVALFAHFLKATDAQVYLVGILATVGLSLLLTKA